MRYFEENLYEGEDLHELHHDILNSVGTVAGNLFFHQFVGAAATTDHRETLARSAYTLIGVCEAIIARVPENEARNALAKVRQQIRPIEEGEADVAIDAIKKLLVAVFD